MPISTISIGSVVDASQPEALKAALAEFISMIIFIFADEGSSMAFSKFYYKVHINKILIYMCFVK